MYRCMCDFSGKPTGHVLVTCTVHHDRLEDPENPTKLHFVKLAREEGEVNTEFFGITLEECS